MTRAVGAVYGRLPVQAKRAARRRRAETHDEVQASRSGRVHRHTFRVIYGDTDQMGVVYYANYLRYFEAGRNELLRALGVAYRDLERDGYALPVAKASARYRAPARYDDELTLETSVAEVGHGTLRITYKLFRTQDQLLLTTGETTHVCVGTGGRVTRLPDELREKIGAE